MHREYIKNHWIEAAMITELYIDNFKSLVDFTLPCYSLTCLIGINNSGKSSILQAIDLLASVSKGQVRDWLASREWQAKDIKSQLKKGRQHTIGFRLRFILDNERFSWEGTFNLNSLSCSAETFSRLDGEEPTLLKVDNNAYTLLENAKRSIDFEYEGSILSSLKEQLFNPELRQIKQFLCSLKSLELLNPLLLRKRARSAENDLGLGGEKLSAFLYSLPPEKRSKIHQQMGSLFGAFNGYHVRAKRSGWKELWISETFRETFPEVSTEARHVSDGFLRILALFSQLQTDNSVLLFDEIEDGLNHEVMEFLMDEIVNSSQQVFFTTHSPMILNFLEDDVARKAVMLVFRDKSSGKTQVCRFFDIPQIQERLEYMGPGEVFANVNLKDLP